jgi:3-phosphoshikimate 1-carboxyvinyltransferase
MQYREIIPLKQSLDFKLTLPGSKSITNRALLCAALADGKSRLFGALESDDTTVMLSALKKIELRPSTLRQAQGSGSKIEGGIEIEGCGGKFKKGNFKLDLHNSGTAVRFLTAIMAIRDGETIITGDERMKERPIGDLADGLRQIGVEIGYLGKTGYPPIRVKSSKLRVKSLGASFVVKMKGDKSSQYFSALLILGPLFPKPLKIEVVGELVSKSYIDTTIAVMKAFGVNVRNNGYKSFVVKPQKYRAAEYQIEGDASAASYWTAMAYLHGGKVGFENLGISAQYAVRSTQKVVPGKSIQGDSGFNDVLVSQMSNIKGQRSIDMNDMPDSAMTLVCMAPFAKGKTTITGLSTLRIKETDRIMALEKELRKIGVNVSTAKDSITIGGTMGKTIGGTIGSKTSPIVFPIVTSAVPPIVTYKDHRMAMCFAVIGTKIPGIVIENPDCVDKTYPKFWEDIERMYLSQKIRLGQKNLVLTGMRCAGKTYLGKKIAKSLGRKFVDLDAEIEKAEGMSVSEVVKKNRWDYFRKVEQNICSEYSKTKNLVISTGGGVVLNPLNMKNLKKNGVNVFVFVDPELLIERMRKSGGRPPLKSDDSISELRMVWEERRGLYLKYADFIWDNTSGKIIRENLEGVFT